MSSQELNTQQNVEREVEEVEHSTETQPSRLRRASALEFTRGDVVRNVAKQLGYGIIEIVVGLVLLLIYYGMREPQAATFGCAIVFPALLLGGIGLILLGIVTAIWNSIRLVTVPARSIRIALCPFCQQENRVLKRVSRFLCQQCGRLLVLGKEGMQLLQATECPHCHRPMGVTSDTGLECLDCGVTLHADAEGKLSLVTKGVEICAECGQPSPDQARFCGHCDSILPRGVVPVRLIPSTEEGMILLNEIENEYEISFDFENPTEEELILLNEIENEYEISFDFENPTEEEIILRSEIGNLRYSAGVLQGLWQRTVDERYGGRTLSESSLTGITQLFRTLTGGTLPRSRLIGITQLFRILTLVIDGFEDALRNPNLKDEVAKQLPLLNQTYGALLLKLRAELLALKDRCISASCAQHYLVSDDVRYVPLSEQDWDTYEWVTAQHTLIDRMGGVQDETTHHWAKNLIEWKADHEENDVWWMKAVNVDPLLEEAQTVAPTMIEKAEAERWFDQES